MTEQEKINLETNLNLAVQDAKFAVFMQELKEQREDIRRLNERQDADRKSLEAKIDSKFDSLSNQIHNLTLAAIVGFGAIAVAIEGLSISALK